MFAVIKTGGKQYRVAPQEVIKVEKLPGEAGDSVLFEEVLLIGDGDNSSIGSPLVAGATVAGEVVEQTRGRKVLIFKKKRRKHYRRTQGHRQHLTEIRITEILTDGAKPSAKKAQAKPAAEKKAAEAEAKPAAEPKAAAKAEETKAKASAKPKAEAKTAKAETTEKTAKPAASKKAADEAKKD